MRSARTIGFDTTGYPDRPGFGTAVARALLERASAGAVGEMFRLNTPARTVAFGKLDAVSPTYSAAVAVARRHGYEAVARLAGGRAAVFHPGTLAFSWTIPTPSPRTGIRQRFEVVAQLMAEAFRNLGTDARIGEVPGEYCPGQYSVNLGGTHKVMGIGQRLTRHAAHIGGVVVVTDGAAVRSVLIPVYAALGLEWDPATAGSLADESPGITVAEVGAAITAQLEGAFVLNPVRPDPATLELAERLLPDHLPAGVGAARDDR